jgi:hypothetical protein
MRPTAPRPLMALTGISVCGTGMECKAMVDSKGEVTE